MNRERFRDSRRGATFVEAALSLLTALLVLVALVQMGIVFMVYQGVSERARVGVRYATTAPDDEQGIKNMIVYGNVDGTGSALLGLSPNDVEIGIEALDNESSITRIHVDLDSKLALVGFLMPRNTSFGVRAASPVERALE